MTISVFNKHNEEPNFHSKLIEKLVHKTDSPLIIKFTNYTYSGMKNY